MKKISKSEYSRMVKENSPASPVIMDSVKAFITGGLICTVGEIFRKFYMNNLSLNEDMAGCATSISLILIAALLTACNVFDKIAKYAGAGTLIPITGFSNAVVSPAMEYKTEGLVTGTASRMFVVAGPVIVYGTVSSIIAGIIYWIIK